MYKLNIFTHLCDRYLKEEKLRDVGVNDFNENWRFIVYNKNETLNRGQPRDGDEETGEVEMWEEGFFFNNSWHSRV